MFQRHGAAERVGDAQGHGAVLERLERARRRAALHLRHQHLHRREVTLPLDTHICVMRQYLNMDMLLGRKSTVFGTVD